MVRCTSEDAVDAVEEIKDRLSIEDLVGRYVDLKRSGASYKGLCPFHSEKTPSFYVSPGRGRYHCFGCGKDGDAFTFMMEMEHLDFPDALKQLAAQTGVRLPERDASQQPSLRNKLYEANAAAARFFRQILDTSQGRRARAYLTERGFGQDAIELFELGYSPDGRESLVAHLASQGFDERIQLEAGLALQDEVGGKSRDRFRGRLMFPIRDASGRVSGFGGRTLGDSQPKYLNSPQTEIFDKSGVLFGINRAQDGIRQAKQAVLVEGYLDAVRAHVSGFPHVVASLGTAVTSRQLTALAKLTERVVVALDPDPAGQSAAARAGLTALAEVTQTRGRAPGAAAALDLRIARLPDGMGDPDELIRDSSDRWQRALDEAVPAFQFYFELTLASLDRASDTWRQEAIDRLLPLIQQFAGSVGWQATWMERLAAETGIEPRILQQQITPAAAPRTRRKTRPQTEQGRERAGEAVAHAVTADPALAVEHALFALLLKVLVLPDEVVRRLDAVEISDARNRIILKGLSTWRSNGNYDYQMFRETLPDEVREHGDALVSRDAPPPEDDKLTVAIDYYLARLRQFRVQARLSRASQMLGEVDTEDKAAAVGSVAQLMSELLEVQQAQDRLSRLAVQAISVTQAQGTMDQDAGSS